MKKFYVSLIVFIIFNFLGCEENFSPKGDFEEKFALSCIVRGDTALQIASLFSNYDVDGYDPSVHTENPAYLGADIRLWYRDTVYIFEDSTVYNISNPDSLFNFYYLDKFKPTEKGELLEIEATLRNGKRLRASCFTPGRFYFDTQETSNTIPPVNTTNVNVLWTTDDTQNFYVGRIKVKYFVNMGGSVSQKWLYLPVRIIENSGDIIPIYHIPSKQRGASYSMNAINHAFTTLSAEIAKENITISTSGLIEILSLDENLSRYYASILEDNKYTVRVNESDYSNVAGGFGVFGSLNRETKRITIQPDYITGFGYKVLIGN